ncbi:LysR family transcriptional regulator [Parendozoicomonas sp. Alg238-R29]|uniref:LysR family transcriptional regulator n=1 Tax=Parendozoicomonas sp. Alg238-R29 TaxID=2993446 RepID=UPI00248ECAF0|nr:LysR family transcriptional regulator [Parendozoicomonas sp. Alg238-R29]
MNSIFGNFDDLYLFCHVVESGSLQKASQNLHLPVSTMSRRLTALEGRLGVRLLERKGRNLSATQTGQIFFNRLSGEFEQSEMELAELLYEEQQIKGNIRLIVPYTIYQSGIGDLVEEFILDYPKVSIDIRLNLDDSVPESDRDLVLGFNSGRQSDLIARPFMKSCDGLYASKSYLDKHGEPHTIEELDTHDWISVQQKRVLHFTMPERDAFSYRIKARMVVNDVKMLIRAVEAGIGIGSIPIHHLPDKNNLAQVLPQHQLEVRQAYLYYRRRKHQPKALTLLIDKLLTHQHKITGLSM